MSISTALSNAASGLTASARAVQVVSSNVANALTEGYAARQIDLTAASLGGVGSGVRVASVTRLVDPALLGLSRDAGSRAQAGEAGVTFWQRLEASIGAPGEGLSKALSGFETALIAASERPDLDSRLAAVVTAATSFADKLGSVEQTVQALRASADADIASDVSALNTGLQRIDKLNDQIVRQRAAGQSTLGLEDDRQALITTLSEVVPMREYARADGRVTLFTTGGQLLLDINPQEIGFTQNHAIDPSMRIGSGLSGLTIGGRAVDPGPDGPMRGGRLAASFALRDTEAVSVQAQLDALAEDLVARFQDPGTDPTLAPGDAGVFTDDGLALGGPAAPGLAGRLTVNDAILPGSGGALWHLRDGLGATTPGPVGDAAQIQNLLSALDRPQAVAPGSPRQDFSSTLTETMTRVSIQRQAAEDIATQSAAHLGEVTQQMLANGVDTDAEMQRLLAVEQAYAANARVIETADAMLRRLLEI